ncbi:MAG: riboflavin synthase [Gemmatimonadota bacterium]|jgi:riboflavin synthase|nr:riboflavin synthase [Gemmatimonadota bacterium]
MFTGIIEETGTIISALSREGGIDFTISGQVTLDGLSIGDSIAVDGVCLTAVAIEPAGFTAHAVGTTLERTTLGNRTAGQRVNLERALALGERLGGHMVLGHVDGVGRVISITRRDDHVLIEFTLPESVDEVSIPLGSITVNGISLTINDLPARGRARVSIIPHTWEVTTMSDLEVGSSVNLEGDLLGKFIRQLMDRRSTGAPSTTPESSSVHVSPSEG